MNPGAPGSNHVASEAARGTRRVSTRSIDAMQTPSTPSTATMSPFFAGMGGLAPQAIRGGVAGVAAGRNEVTSSETRQR